MGGFSILRTGGGSGLPGTSRDPRDPRDRPSGTRGLHQSLLCAIAALFASLFLLLRLSSLSHRFAFRFASLRFSLRFTSLRILEAHTPTGRWICIYIYIQIYRCMHMDVSICLYVYVYVYVYVYIYRLHVLQLMRNL